MSADEGFREWAILELMGHRKLAGLVTEQELGGAKLIRIDVPGEDGVIATQFYGGGAIYCLTPVTEELARRVAKGNQPAPVTRWELPAPDVQTKPLRDLDNYGEYSEEEP